MAYGQDDTAVSTYMEQAITSQKEQSVAAYI